MYIFLGKFVFAKLIATINYSENDLYCNCASIPWILSAFCYISFTLDHLHLRPVSNYIQMRYSYVLMSYYSRGTSHLSENVYFMTIRYEISVDFFRSSHIFERINEEFRSKYYFINHCICFYNNVSPTTDFVNCISCNQIIILFQ